MSVMSLADRLITVYRRTAVVLAAVAAAATHAAAMQPARASLIEVTLAGTGGCTGTVVVSGTVNGSADTETLTFVGPGKQVTKKRFSALAAPTAFTTSGLAGETPAPTISALAVGADGSPTVSDVVVVTEWPMRHDAGTASWPNRIPGSAEVETTRLYMGYTTLWGPREDDLLVDTVSGEEWRVIGTPAQHGGGMRIPNHIEIRVQRHQITRTG